MALKAFLENFEGIDPESTVKVVDLYKQGEDGKLVLDVETVGSLGLEDVGALKRSLENEVQRRKDAKTSAEAYEALGIEPAEIKASLAELEELKKFDPDKEADARAAKKVEAAMSEIQDKAASQLAEKDAVITKFQNAIEARLIDDVAHLALKEHGGSPALLMPIVKKETRVRWNDETPVVEVMNDQGAARLKDVASGTLMGINDRIGEMKTDPMYAGAFVGTPAAGVGEPVAQPKPGAPVPPAASAELGDPKHRGDFKTLTDKGKWIEEHGVDKFMDLPPEKKVTGSAA